MPNNTPELLIGLAGKARTGKDTAAQHISLNYGLVPIAYANPLRDGLLVMLGIKPEDLEGSNKEEVIPEIGKSPRELLQTLGTEWGRDLVHPNIWIWCAQKQLERRRHAATYVGAHFAGALFTDVRFENEASWIRCNGGTVIHVERPDALQVRNHKSERGVAVDPSDYLITNDCSIETLLKKVDDVMADVLCRHGVPLEGLCG